MTVYGYPQYLPVDETHPCKPANFYGVAKALGEEILLALAQKTNIDLWVLRLPGLFSETRRTGAIYSFIHAAIRGQPVVISAAQPTPWDVLHVADALGAIDQALLSNCRNPSSMNIGYGGPVDLVTIASQIIAIAGTRVPLQNVGGVSHPVFQMDTKRARHLLGWSPCALKDRLEDMLNIIAREEKRKA
jgi:nucleoside-diphosphate-sugar epimerase